jgi:acetylglutamate kinase
MNDALNGITPGASGARLQRSSSSQAPWVIKIGGLLCEDRDSRTNLARACASLQHPLVLVHGGGAAVTRLQTLLGGEPQFVEGRRVTSVADMALVEMVLTGSINGDLVRALQVAGRAALGLSGCDAGLLRCQLVEGLGRVGRPVHVEPQSLHVLLEAGYTPVVSPVSLGPDGEAVNVNADEAACAIAAGLGAARLLLLSDVEGVRVESTWQADVAGDRVEDLVASGEVTGGMIPKLRAAAAATAHGVGEVRIAGFAAGDLELVRGTRVHAAGGRPAAMAAGSVQVEGGEARG